MATSGTNGADVDDIQAMVDQKLAQLTDEQKQSFLNQIKRSVKDFGAQDEYDDCMHMQDEIHEYIPISNRIKQIIDTPAFQRLRHLMQLGATYYVFPGGTHKRFEHSIGVSHLAGLLIDHIRLKQPNLCAQRGIDAEIAFCVRAAGLLHDVGHGPFSHVFDNEFVPSVREAARKKQQQAQESKENENGNENTSTNADGNEGERVKFRHEDMSVRIIDYIYNNNEFDPPISEDSIELIKALVSPSTFPDVKQKYVDRKQGFLFQIIANDDSGIDVDKWDYMLRDARNVRVKVAFNYRRILEHARVIDDQICYVNKTAYDIYLLFRTRYELFKRVYSHKTSKAIEYMICDILKYANDYYDIVSKIDNVEDYLQLTDSILPIIKLSMVDIDALIKLDFDNLSPENKATVRAIVPHHRDLDMKACLGLKMAQGLHERLDNRDLYRAVGYCLISPHRLSEILATEAKEFENDGDNGSEQNQDRSDDNDNDNENDSVNTGVDLNIRDRSPHTPPSGKARSKLRRIRREDEMDKQEEEEDNVDGYGINSSKYVMNERQFGQEWKKRLGQMEKKMEMEMEKEMEGKESSSSDESLVDTTKFKFREIALKWKQELFNILLNTIDKENEDYGYKRFKKPQEDNVRLHLMSLSYGKETVHPIEKVYLYNPKTPNQKFCVAPSQIAFLNGNEYREITLRVFVTERQFVDVGKKAFKEFAKEKGLVNCDEDFIDSAALSPNTNKKRHGRLNSSPSNRRSASSAIRQFLRSGEAQRIGNQASMLGKRSRSAANRNGKAPDEPPKEKLKLAINF